jgi:iron complex transport system permease protein
MGLCNRHNIGVRYLVLALLLLTAFLLALHVGAVSISYWQMLQVLLLPRAHQGTEFYTVLWFLRVPRLLAILLVGMGLGVAGAVMQGLLRNPLADPGLLGVSSGASLAILLFWMVGGGLTQFWFWQFLQPLIGLLGGVAVLCLLYFCVRWTRQKDMAGLVLIGLACNALFSSCIAFLLYLGPTRFLDRAVMWSFGGVTSISWSLLTMGAVLYAAGGLLLFKQAAALNLLALGEEEAGQMGLNLSKFKYECTFGVALMVAASVSLAGPIAFVGLIVPHIMRRILGPDHRHLLPCSALAGGIFLLSADMLSQTISRSEIMPLGIITALLGAVFFLWLLFYYRSRQ